MTHHLAQLNIARLAAPLESEQLRDFREAIDEVNAIGDASPGWVWRLADESGDATSIRPWGDDFIVNMTVWRDLDSLRAFAYDGRHRDFVARRREWFVPMAPYQVCWWVPTGHIPTLDEARDRLDHLGAQGPTAYAFTPAKPFDPPAG